MAKTQFPIPAAKNGFLSKVVSAVLLITVLTVVVKHPAEAASWASTGFAALGGLIDGLTNFLRAVLS